MKLETLKALLDVNKRKKLYSDIISFFERLDNLNDITFKKYEIPEGIIPVVLIGKSFDVSSVKNVKLFVGSQHNEYNGLFGVLDYLKMIQKQKVRISDILIDDQILVFAPLMNPYGFLNPSKDNKSGYYLKNGTNLNRFWRRAFAPEYKHYLDDHIEYPLPKQVEILKSLLEKYWKKEDISIYILDFHETSLLERFPIELSKKLKEASISYKFDHWLKEGIIINVMKLSNIPYFRKPLFYKCNPSANHTHINLSIKQIDIVHEKLLRYISTNQWKLPFYFCYSDKSKEYCERLANKVYNKLKNKLWETAFASFDHHFHDHGCLVKMSDATLRKNIYSMELESQKHFFNLFDEIEKSKTDPQFFQNKLHLINLSLELAVETIKEMINIF